MTPFFVGLRSITSPNINRFPKFFYCQNQETICNKTVTIDSTTHKVRYYTTLWNVSVLRITIKNMTTFITTHFEKLTTETTCLLSQLLSKITSHSFHIKCSMCPPCCWTTHPSRRRHWPMVRSAKRCGRLPHSVTITCFSWLIDVNRQHWWAICWRISQTT